MERAESGVRRAPVRKVCIALLGIGIAAIAALVGADRLWPLPLDKIEGDTSAVVLAADGSLLRAFPDRDGVRRFRVELDAISPLYLEALIGYEDRHFYRHAGINPFSMARAVMQRFRHGRWISGGSTLSMQVARLLEPYSRTVPGKIRQMFRALQLEMRFDKDEILALYVNYAPFGGNVEGVEAAARRYLGKTASSLSRGEAALLTVLPQAPSRNRPDRHPARAIAARDKVLNRLAEHRVWDDATVALARAETLAFHSAAEPLDAPHLALRLHHALGTPVIHTPIDAELQRRIEYAAARHARQMGPGTSASVIIVDNRDRSVIAYLGAARFADSKSHGYIDMARAARSPGSTLKPLIYALATEWGVIHSASALFDVPRDFDGYRPQNFSGDFLGLVPADEALRRSLNVPAVDLLDRIGAERFAARLAGSGIDWQVPGGEPSLALALGGFGIALDELVRVYVALASDGQVRPLRWTRDADMDLESGRLLVDPGAAWIARQMLREPAPPGQPAPLLAIKTGTSYGYRDAWALGISDHYTLGVWVGRPDGTPVKGQYGAATAEPLLATIHGFLGDRADPPPRPATVKTVGVCWPMAEDCRVQREAWTLNGVVPRIANVRYQGAPAFTRLAVRLNASDEMLPPGCRPGEGEPMVRVNWAPWLAATARSLPGASGTPVAADCEAASDTLVIAGLEPGATIVAHDGRIPTVSLRTIPGIDAQWLVNERPAGVGDAVHVKPSPGVNRVVALSGTGHATLEFAVAVP